MMKVAPCPGSLSRRISPPWSLTMPQVTAQLLADLDPLQLELMTDDRDRVLDHPVDLDRLEDRLLLTGKFEQIFDNRLAALGLLLDEQQVLLEGRAALRLPQGELRAPQDAGQRILDLVRDARAELSDGGQLLGLEDLRVRLPEGPLAGP